MGIFDLASLCTKLSEVVMCRHGSWHQRRPRLLWTVIQGNDVRSTSHLIVQPHTRCYIMFETGIPMASVSPTLKFYVIVG